MPRRASGDPSAPGPGRRVGGYVAGVSSTTMRPRRVGEILDAGIKIYVGSARTLLGLTAVVVVPMQLLASLILLSTLPSGNDVPAGAFGLSRPRPTNDAAAVLGGQVTVGLVQLIVTTLVTAACVKAISDIYLDHPTGIEVSLRFAVRRLPALIAMQILYLLGLIVGFIALIIPGIRLYGLWAVDTPSLLIEGLGPIKALGRSRRLVKGRWWPVAGVVLISAIMVAVVNGLISAVLVGVASLPSQPSLVLAVFTSVIASAIATILVTPFQAAVTTVLYYDLRVRREGFDLQLLADQLGLPAPEGDQSADWQQVSDYSEGERAFGPESVGQPGGPPFWPPPPGWRPGQ